MSTGSTPTRSPNSVYPDSTPAHTGGSTAVVAVGTTAARGFDREASPPWYLTLWNPGGGISAASRSINYDGSKAT